jgi:hypothetical protein
MYVYVFNVYVYAQAETCMDSMEGTCMCMCVYAVCVCVCIRYICVSVYGFDVCMYNNTVHVLWKMAV